MKKNNNPKRVIRVKVDECSCSTFYGKLSAMTDYINDLVQTHGKDIYVEFIRDFYYDYDTNPTPMYIFHVERLETDEEYAARVEKETEWQRNVEISERETLRRLSEKYQSK